MERDEATLLDIARAARLVLEFKAGMDKAAFFEDVKTQSAVLHQLMVIGEAVKRLSPEFRSCYPEMPWSLIAGMRDKLIHGYDIVDLEEVWRTAEIDVPDLLSQIKPLLPDQE
ncbi:MAG: DUF86 domain-containing protein [Chloroflexota bacterium]